MLEAETGTFVVLSAARQCGLLSSVVAQAKPTRAEPSQAKPTL